jgi:prepilin signal peptidase PulO-like enzyme (type II secretory pathway)
MVDWLTLAAISPQATNIVLTKTMWWLVIIWLGILGGAVGSFLTVVWDRLGTGEGFVLPRSRCPECDRPIRWYHNVPVVGWLLLRGRCYDCGSRIPLKHPLVELAFAILFILIGLATPWLQPQAKRYTNIDSGKHVIEQEAAETAEKLPR